jgi:hypothetical protein
MYIYMYVYTYERSTSRLRSTILQSKSGDSMTRRLSIEKSRERRPLNSSISSTGTMYICKHHHHHH